MASLAAAMTKIARTKQLGITSKLEYFKDVLRLHSSRWKDIGHLNLFGFEITYNSWDALSHLLTEIFVDFCYYTTLRTEAPVIFDIGANIGIAALFYKKIYPASVIYSFEPDPDTFLILDNNIRNNGLKDVFAFKAAISNIRGKTKLHVPSWSNGSSSLLREKVEIEMGYASRCTATKPFLEEKEVDVLKCADFIAENKISHIDIMKIDVEGAEDAIMSDISGKLEIIDVIFMEYHYAADLIKKNSLASIISILERAGFVISLQPMWFARTTQPMCTYLLKGVNSNREFIGDSGLADL
jgi:FkbM family methyltransferase